MIKPGSVLVAHPDLQDEFFEFSVVLITENHKGGTVGLTLNKMHRSTFSEAMDFQDWPLSEQLYCGGPVNPRALILLHTAGWYSSNTLPVNTDFSISSDLLMTEKMAMGNTPTDYRFISGMSGWKPGQLDEEIQKNRWLTVPATSRILFETSGETQWREAVNAYAEIAVAQYF